jgi:hydrogenase expression/formation protein HypE
LKSRNILLSHGSGGKLTRELIHELLLKELGNRFLNPLTDSAILPPVKSKIAFTTDSYVVKPLFFPGGDIGKLSICGTVNDLSVAGAKPLYISLGFILEEGLLLDDLERTVRSIKVASQEAGVRIVTGDTKVTEKGKGDGIFINTSGIGVIEDNELSLSAERIEVGDKVIVSGSLGDHGASVLSKREGLSFEGVIESDCAPLNHLIESLIPIGSGIKFMRDPTRGGLAGVLNEVAEQNLEIVVKEESIPLKETVSGFCEILGIDPLYLACEGRVVVICAENVTQDILKTLQNHPLGKGAALVGEVTGDSRRAVYLQTAYGTKRLLDMPAEDNLPRIC